MNRLSNLLSHISRTWVTLCLDPHIFYFTQISYFDSIVTLQYGWIKQSLKEISSVVTKSKLLRFLWFVKKISVVYPKGVTSYLSNYYVDTYETDMFLTIKHNLLNWA